MVRFFISGYYGLNNIGDEAILSGMLSSLKKYFNNSQYSVLTNDAIITQSIHDVDPVEHTLKQGSLNFAKNVIIKNEIGNIIKEISRCDIFILGGGSLLQDLKIHYLPILLSQIRLAKNMKKKTIIYGIGAGPIDTKLGQLLCRSIINEVDLITVRDEMSKQVLEKCGIKNVIQTADPAFGLEIPQEPNVNLPFDDGTKNWGGYFTTTSYNWLHDSDLYKNLSTGTNDLSDRRKKLAQIYDEILKEKQKKLLFLPTVKIDQDGYQEIQKNMACKTHTKIVEFSNDIPQVLSLLSRSEMLIGMRLHSLILATLLGKPIVPISYCGKVKSYLEMIGMNGLYLDIEELDHRDFLDHFLNNFNEVYDNKSHYSKLQHDASIRLRVKAIKNAELVYNLWDNVS